MKAEEGEKLKDVKLKNQQFAIPSTVGATVRETQKLMKNVLPILQRSMQLYLANKDTESILYRPIKVHNTPKRIFKPCVTAVYPGLN